MKVDLINDNKEKYYSQLNNQLSPYIACQVTSMVMALDIAGFGLDPIMKIPCVLPQAEDKLRWYMLTDDDVQTMWKTNHKNNLHIPAPEWADCMVFAINKLYEKNIAYYQDRLTLDMIIADLVNCLPVYISMKYPNNKNFAGNPAPIDGHIVVVVGVETFGNTTKITINDPYKNHLTGEKDGFKNIYTLDEFNRHFNNRGIRLRVV